MLKTSFPDVAATAKTWRVRVYGNHHTGRAAARRSNKVHVSMSNLDRAALCRRLDPDWKPA